MKKIIIGGLLSSFIWGCVPKNDCYCDSASYTRSIILNDNTLGSKYENKPIVAFNFQSNEKTCFGGNCTGADTASCFLSYSIQNGVDETVVLDSVLINGTSFGSLTLSGKSTTASVTAPKAMDCYKTMRDSVRIMVRKISYR